MDKTRRLKTDFREMRSELSLASNVNKWRRRCKDGKSDDYQRCRISLNKTIKGIDRKRAVLRGFTVVG